MTEILQSLIETLLWEEHLPALFSLNKRDAFNKDFLSFYLVGASTTGIHWCTSKIRRLIRVLLENDFSLLINKSDAEVIQLKLPNALKLGTNVGLVEWMIVETK